MAQTRKPEHTDHVRAVAADARAPATSLVAASWRRSLALHGLDPAEHRLPETLDAAGLAAHREAMGGLVSVALGMTLLLLALKRGDVGMVAILSSVTPILLLPLLWLRLRRVPAKGAWCGAAITVIGTALILSR